MMMMMKMTRKRMRMMKRMIELILLPATLSDRAFAPALYTLLFKNI